MIKHLIFKVVSSSMVLLIATPNFALAGGQVGQINSQFARDLYASRSSILIIGDSTNNPRGSGTFVPYYEGFIQTLPDEIELCGFRVSGSTGNIGVNSYIKFAGGSGSQIVGGGISVRTPSTLVGTTGHASPGYRNEFKIIEGGALPAIGRFASVGFVNLGGIYPNAEQWVQGRTLVLRTPFYITSDGSMLSTMSMHPLSDHDGSAGNSVSGFDIGESIPVAFDNDRFGLQMVDAVFVHPETTRIGVRFSGDIDTDDANESGKIVAWSDHILFDREIAQLDRGVYFDSVSIGGYTAGDHWTTLDPMILDDYFLAAPRPLNTIIVWLGQNAQLEEWNGHIQPVWGQRIEAITDMAIQASIDSGATVQPVPVLITPPLADGDFPSLRFLEMNEVLDEIATRRGWGHIDLHSLVGNALTNINPTFDGPGPHPSQEGALYLTSLFYDQLNCLRAEYTGDGVRNFFDVSAFLTLFANMDPQADLNGDGIHNFFDISMFLNAFSTPCP